jgi:epoxyqueuosine reductase QueG
MTADGQQAPPTEGQALARLCEKVIRDFLADSARNNLGPGCADPAWEDFLLGFAAGDDPLWEGLKEGACPQHWTPAQAFAAARGGQDPDAEAGVAAAGGAGVAAAGEGGVAAAGGAGVAAAGEPAAADRSKQPATDWAASSPGVQPPRTPSPQAASDREAAAPGAHSSRTVVAPGGLTVISWAVSQTEATKAANRIETLMPSEAWARARVFGQEANRKLHLALLEALRARGYEAIAPALLPAWGQSGAGTNAWSSNWSERHVAYVAGLGTFGLSGGLITSKGKAVRFGSVVVDAAIAATPRAYAGPFAYCLHLSGGVCAECADRCPAGSVTVEGRDKEACIHHLNRCEEYVKREYRFDGYGCGLCQTGVPCESRIPAGLEPKAQGPASSGRRSS